MQSIQAAQPLTTGFEKTVSAGRLRRFLLRLVLILAGVAVGLGLAEVIMRAFHLGQTRMVVLYNDSSLKLPPHFKFTNLKENRNEVETNNLGFHDYERQTTNSNYRILFLGDSFLEARHVNTDSLFTIRLEKKFTQEGQRIEVINGGVPGTGTVYQYMLWKEFFEPTVKVDHLVLCFYMGNDLVDNNVDLTAENIWATGSPYFVDGQGKILKVGNEPGAVKKGINLVRDHSVLFNTFYELAFQIRKTLRGNGGVDGADDEGRDRTTAWQASEQGTIALLKRWQTELGGKNIPLDVVLIDRPGKVYNKFEREFMDRLRATCTQDHFDCLRLKLTNDPFESYSFDGVSLGHFNYKGHELAASELYDFFKSHHAAIFTQGAAAQALRP